jgi:hypothetical protein
MNRTYRSFFACLCISLMLAAVLSPVWGADVWWRGTTSTSTKLAANFSPAAIPTSVDTLRFTGDSAAAAFVQDTVLSVYRILADATFDENFKQAGYRITTVAGASFDAVGTGDTISLDSMFVVTGDGNFNIEAGPVYVHSITTTQWDLRGTGNLNYNAPTRYINKLTCAYSGKTTTRMGTAILTVQKLTLMAGSFSPTVTTEVRPKESADLSFDVAHTIIGATGSFQIVLDAAAAINIPQINAAGFTGTLSINNRGGNAATANLTGAINAGGILSIYTGTDANFICNTGDNAITAGGEFRLGSNEAANSFTFNAGASAIDANGGIQNTTYNGAGGSNINLQTSTINASGNISLGSNTVVDAGTSTLTLDGASGTQVIKLANRDNQPFYDVTFSGAAEVKDSTPGGFKANGDVTSSSSGNRSLYFGMECAGDALIDGTGIPTIAGNVTMSSNTAQIHVGGTVGTPVTPGCTLVVTGSACNIDFDKNATIAAISAAAGKVPTNTGTGNLTLGAQSKKSIDSLCIAGGTVTTADDMTVGALNLASGTLNLSGDSVYATRLINLASGATFTTDASSAVRIANNGKIYTGGKSLPNTYAAGDFSLYDGATIARLTWQADGKTGTFEAGETFTLTNLAAADWQGSAGSLNALRSTTTNTQFTLALPNAVTLSYMNPQDCKLTGYSITVNDRTSIDGGNNTRWIWPILGGDPLGAFRKGAFRKNAFKGAFRKPAYR